MIEAAAARGRISQGTGLYTSPHLKSVTERIRVSGVEISEDEFAAAFEVVSAAIEKLLASGALPKHPSFFECVTAMAWVHFRNRACDIQVLEVGMGGRLDATNITRPVVSVITPVDFDHEAYLGNTMELIAGEKAGIVKDGGVVVMSPQNAIASRVIESVAEERGARVIRAGGRAEGYELSLLGEHQKQNAATAIATLRELHVEDAAIRRGLASTEWRGRLQLIGAKPATYLDGAHNPAGARVLRDFLATTQHPRVLVFGAMRDKAIGEGLRKAVVPRDGRRGAHAAVAPARRVAGSAAGTRVACERLHLPVRVAAGGAVTCPGNRGRGWHGGRRRVAVPGGGFTEPSGTRQSRAGHD